MAAEQKLFKDLIIKPTECTGDGEICSSKPVQEKMLEVAGTYDIEEALNKLKEKTDCKSESCVIQSKILKLPGSVIEKELEINFKPKGPRNSTALLSNINIDNNMVRWAREYDNFFPCPFAMMDFDKTHESFSTISMPDVYNGNYVLDLGSFGKVKRKNNCFGCVVNTDTSNGPGKHWVAVFVDMRKPDATIEYFNSVGNPPPKPMIVWLERTKKTLNGLFKSVTVHSVTSVEHQFKDTECGVYSLFYIRKRLEGEDFSFFEDKDLIIKDDLIKNFRKFLFRGG